MLSVNRAAWHAVTSPESPGGEGFAKGRHRWVRSPRARHPTAREARLQGRFAYRRDVPPGRIRLFGQPSRRTGESPRTRCTAHPVGYTSSFVICRFRRTRHRARRFCERWARQRPRSQGGCAPAAPAPRRSRCEGRSESEQGKQRFSPLAIASSGRGRADQARGTLEPRPLNKGVGPAGRPSGRIERSCASPESEEGDSARYSARQRWSSCRCPSAVVRRGDRDASSGFPPGSSRTGRCASFTMGRRSHRSEKRR